MLRKKDIGLVAICAVLAGLNFTLLFSRLPRDPPPPAAAGKAQDAVREKELPGRASSLRLSSYLRHLQERPRPPKVATVRLSSGSDMPLVGFGTAGLGEATEAAVAAALEAGYTLLDSAQAREWYREDLVGRALAAAAAPRHRLFLTSKLHPRDLGYNRTLAQFQQSLRDLHTSYLDLFLLHYPRCWPGLCAPERTPEATPEGTWRDSWRALEALHAQGRVTALGVSNFDVRELEELLRFAKVKPAVVQSRSDPLASDRPLRDFCARHGIQFQGYSTLGTQWALGSSGGAGRPNPVLSHPVIGRIAAQHGRSAAQVTLRWALQTGQAVVPRSAKAAHMAANLELGFQLTPRDMAALEALDGTDPWGDRGGDGALAAR